MNEKMYKLGYSAALAGETRLWCEQHGDACLAGFDAYWNEVHDKMGLMLCL